MVIVQCWTCKKMIPLLDGWVLDDRVICELCKPADMDNLVKVTEANFEDLRRGNGISAKRFYPPKPRKRRAGSDQ